MIEYTVKVYKDRTEWFLDGKRHRVDGPAISYANGDKVWYQYGNLHREDGPAVEYANGDKCWYINNRYHRVDGPAVIWSNGDKFWYQHGNLHREDGPAIEYENGTKLWFLNDVEYSEEKFNKKMHPVKELTVSDIEKLLGHKVKIVK